jgi:hypothetical protein
MTPDQLTRIRALNACSMLPGSYDKRFARALETKAAVNPEAALSEKQDAYLSQLIHKYRRQIKPEIVAGVKVKEGAA